MAGDIAMATKECLHIIEKETPIYGTGIQREYPTCGHLKYTSTVTKDIMWEEDGVGERL